MAYQLNISESHAHMQLTKLTDASTNLRLVAGHDKIY